MAQIVLQRQATAVTASRWPAALPAAVAVRDSKDPGGPKLIFTPADWAAFTTAIRTGA